MSPCDSGQPLFVVSVVEEEARGLSPPCSLPGRGFPRLRTLLKAKSNAVMVRFIKLSVTDKEAANLVATKLL